MYTCISGEWFGIVTGQILSFLTKLSAHHTSLFSLPDDNWNNYQWIYSKLGMCINIVEIWFEIANGQISSFFFDRVICPPHNSGRVLLFHIFIV